MAYHLKYKGPEIDKRLDLAGTALQEHQDISHLATKEEVAKVSDAKEDVIEDLEEIRSGAKLGSTSIQEHQDISHLASKTDVSSGLNKKVDKVEGKGLSTEDYTTAEKQKLAALDTTIKQAVDELQVEVAKKQDSIEDLEEIREGASKGATALQEHQDISNLATKEEVSNGLDNKVDKIDGKGLSTEDFTFALKTKLESLNNYNDTELSNAIASLQTQFDTLVSGNASDAINSFNEIIAFLDGVKDSEDLSSIIASIEQQIAGKMDKVTLATVATSGSYNDLSNKPTIPSAVTESTVSEWGFAKSSALQTKAEDSSVVHKTGNETITGAKTFNSGVNFLGSGDTNAVTLSTNTRINVNGTNKTVLGFGSGTFYINHGDYKLLLRGKDTRPTYNSTTLALSSDVSGKQDVISDLATIRDGAAKGATALQSVPLEYVTESELMWIKAEGEAGVRLKGTNGTAAGNLAISAGDDKTASDGTPFASAASGDHAVVFGYGNTCSGRTTLAQGLYNIVTAKDSVAFGQRNIVNGDQAFAVGQQNEVSARMGVAIGYKNKATNTDSIAIGYQNTSSGSASVAMGDTCEANGTSSTAMGYKTKATGAYSSTFGQNTQATNNGEVAMGLYNKSTTSNDASEQTLFSFGIGTSDTNRVNAFEIKKNGDVYIGDKILSNFATSQYVDEAITNAIITTLNTEV